MNKLAISSLAALVAVAGLSAPVLAASLSSDTSSSSDNFNEVIVLQQLKARGIYASDLSDWNGVIRATVTLADGSTTFQYFDIDTLRPVSAIGGPLGQTRVLSKRDLGQAAVRDAVPQSLSDAESED
jgi:hypothetical protein